MTNGMLQPGAPPSVPPTMSADTPLAYYTPIAITPGTIKWFMGAVFGIITFLAATPVAERYLMPAKDTDLQTLTKIVAVINTKQEETNAAVKRLTEAVDNLSGIVSTIKQVGKVKNATGVLKLR
jgi:hypothetical protein